MLGQKKVEESFRLHGGCSSGIEKVVEQKRLDTGKLVLVGNNAAVPTRMIV